MKYLETRYNLADKKITNYPKKFTKFIFKDLKLKKKQKLLEIGCGRGDFANEFSNRDLNVYAVDYDKSCSKFLKKNIIFRRCDISKNKIPFSDNFFDIVYSKSVIEHLLNPKNFIEEAKRVLKNRGILITLTPDWETQYLHFFDDITHVKPYTKISLKEVHLMYGFNNCEVKKFWQLPIMWKLPILKILAKILSIIVPIRCKISFLRWIKETMLISIAKKNSK